MFFIARPINFLVRVLEIARENLIFHHNDQKICTVANIKCLYRIHPGSYLPVVPLVREGFSRFPWLHFGFLKMILNQYDVKNQPKQTRWNGTSLQETLHEDYTHQLGDNLHPGQKGRIHYSIETANLTGDKKVQNYVMPLKCPPMYSRYRISPTCVR